MKKNNLSKMLMIFSVAALLSGCSVYSVSSHSSEFYTGSGCSNPTYVATMSKTNFVIQAGQSVDIFSPKDLCLSALLKDAQTKYGDKVTIQNVRWDMRNGKNRIGVIYDVIICK